MIHAGTTRSASRAPRRTLLVFLVVLVCGAAAAEEWSADVHGTVARRYPSLARLEVRGTMLDAFYYQPSGSVVINKRRSELAGDHPLHVRPDDDLSSDDVVLIRTRSDAPSAVAHYVVFSEGPSADPEFYLVRVDDPEVEELPLLTGATIAVIPGDGTIFTYGRYNAWFPQRRLFRMREGKPLEVQQPFHLVDVESSVAAELTMRSAPDAGEIVARLAAGEAVHVLLADGNVRPGGSLVLLVRNEMGLVGWVTVQLSSATPPLSGLGWIGD